jgi:hypothetical protein
MLGILRTAQPFLAGAVQGGWLRSAEPFDKGRYGWALEDGSSLGGLGRLMIRAQGPGGLPTLAPPGQVASTLKPKRGSFQESDVE